MSTSDKDAREGGMDRRSFFRAGTGAAVAAAAVVAPQSEAAATENQSERVKARYRETDHVKTFYRVNRY